MDWRELAEAGQWSQLESHLWYDLEKTEQAELLAIVRSAVPTIVVKNGMETETRFKMPNEIEAEDVELQAAAWILCEGELQAAVEGDPPPASVAWGEMRSKAEAFLREALEKPEVTKGDAGRSRRAHAGEALESLAHLDNLDAIYVPQMKRKADQAWLREMIADVALVAFEAGRQAQVVWSKNFEGHAVRGIGTLASAQKGAEGRKGKLADDTSLRLAEMRRLTQEEGHAVTSAAEALARRGIGKSAQANRALWHRHNPKKL